MKHLYLLSLLCIILVMPCITACSDDDADNVLKSGITEQSWTDGNSLEINTGQTLSVTFNAKAKWSATSTEAWCEVLTKSGQAGESTLNLLVSTTTTTTRTATIRITVSGYASSSFSITQNAESTPTGDLAINTQVDAYLREMYLWNDEYKTLKLDFTQNYEDFFYGALGSMTTNTLDKKETTNGKYTLFSYIEKKEAITRSTKLVDKELEYSFGITGMIALNLNGIGYCFSVQGVYPDSPAKKAGIKRGDIIVEINGAEITSGSLSNHFYNLVYPTQVSTIRLGLYNSEGEKSITSEAMYLNPVIKKQVKTINNHKIGYLVYSGFDAAFDEELFDSLKYLKNEGITDFILDLRYNGGGHTISANLIASCIAGSASQNKVFAQYRYNDERMKEYDNKRPEEQFAYSSYRNLGTSLTAGALNLSRVYCLVGSNTASSSELVINSLKGIDIEVILIGETTVGKNVGMEYTDLKIDDSTYRVVPISFQTYNAKGFSDYSTGFTPNLQIDENDPKNEGNTFYNYREYGSDEEYLYAAAVKMITGQDTKAMTRSSENVMQAKKYQLPKVFRPGHDGMLKKYEK